MEDIGASSNPRLSRSPSIGHRIGVLSVALAPSPRRGSHCRHPGLRSSRTDEGGATARWASCPRWRVEWCSHTSGRHRCWSPAEGVRGARAPRAASLAPDLSPDGPPKAVSRRGPARLVHQGLGVYMLWSRYRADCREMHSHALTAHVVVRCVWRTALAGFGFCTRERGKPGRVTPAFTPVTSRRGSARRVSAVPSCRRAVVLPCRRAVKLLLPPAAADAACWCRLHQPESGGRGCGFSHSLSPSPLCSLPLCTPNHNLLPTPFLLHLPTVLLIHSCTPTRRALHASTPPGIAREGCCSSPSWSSWRATDTPTSESIPSNGRTGPSPHGGGARPPSTRYPPRLSLPAPPPPPP